MPAHDNRICVEPGCGARFTPIRKTQHRCPTHHPDYVVQLNAAKNARPIREIYDDPRWRRQTRALVLKRDRYTCVHCGKPGRIVDHTDGIDNILNRGGNPFDPDECQTLCHQCSGAKDGARARGGRPADETPRHPSFREFSSRRLMRAQSDADAEEVWAA